MLRIYFKYLLLLISSTWRIKTDNLPLIKRGIICFWHGDMLPVWYIFKNRKNKFAVVSKSKDGEILSDYLKALNYKLIRGSSSRESKLVFQRIMNALDNNIVLMTPDGPRGPIHKFKAGAIVAAVRKNVPLFICQVKHSKSFIFKKSWDKFSLPLPFTMIRIKFIEIKIPSTDERNSIDDCIKKTEEIMNDSI